MMRTPKVQSAVAAYVFRSLYDFRCGVNRTRNSLSVWMSEAVLANPPRRRCTLILDFIQQINNDVGLVDAQSIEVLPHSQSQLLLLHSPLRLRSSHCGRKASDAIAEHNVAKRVLERGGGVEAVGPSVAL